MKKFLKNLLITVSVIVFPNIVFAAPANFRELVGVIIGLISQLTYLGMAVGFLAFIWGVVQFIMKAESATMEDAKNKMFWGLVGLFVMLSIWGIIRIIAITFGIAL